MDAVQGQGASRGGEGTADIYFLQAQDMHGRCMHESLSELSCQAKIGQPSLLFMDRKRTTPIFEEFS